MASWRYRPRVTRSASLHKGDPQNFTLFLRLLYRDAYADVDKLDGSIDAAFSRRGPHSDEPSRTAACRVSMVQRRLAAVLAGDVSATPA